MLVDWILFQQVLFANEAELSNFSKLVTIMLSAVYPKTRTRNNSVWFPLGLWYARIPV